MRGMVRCRVVCVCVCDREIHYFSSVASDSVFLDHL